MSRQWHRPYAFFSLALWMATVSWSSAKPPDLPVILVIECQEQEPKPAQRAQQPPLTQTNVLRAVPQKQLYGGAILLEGEVFGGEESAEPPTLKKVTTDQAAEIYHDAECLMHEGRTEEACQLYEQVQEIAPKSRYAEMAQDRLSSLKDLRADNPSLKQPVPTRKRTKTAQGAEEASSIDRARKSIFELLDQNISLEVENVALARFLALVSQSQGINIECDSTALKEEGISPRRKITFYCKNATFGKALKQMLKPMKLDYVVKANCIFVTTARVAQGPIVIAAYDVGNLLYSWDVSWDRKSDTLKVVKNEQEETRVTEMARLILDGIEPMSWEKRGGVGSLEYAVETKALIVRHHPRVHEQVQALLASMAKEQQVHKAHCHQRARNQGTVPHAHPTRPTCPYVCPVPQPVQGHAIVEILKKAQQPKNYSVTSEGKTYSSTVGGSEASEPPPSVSGLSYKPQVCYEVDVDKSSGRSRARFQFQMGPLFIQAFKNKEGHGTISIKLQIQKEARQED